MKTGAIFRRFWTMKQFQTETLPYPPAQVIETAGVRCYIPRMTSNLVRHCGGRSPAGPVAHSTMAFAAIGDHVRLPARFFARLFASDGSRLRR